MASLFIIILMFTAFILILLKHSKTGLAVLGLAMVLFLFIGIGAAPTLLLAPLQKPYVSQQPPQWQVKNAIILLTGGSLKLPLLDKFTPTILASSRILKAAQLYFDCVHSGTSCTLIVSGGDPRALGESEAKTYRSSLLRLNIPASDIIIESNSPNTFKNAAFTSAFLKNEVFNQIILVTSGYHLKRALLYFKHFGITAKPSAADYIKVEYPLIPFGYNLAITDLAVHEYVGILQFYVYNALSLNK